MHWGAEFFSPLGQGNHYSRRDLKTIQALDEVTGKKRPEPRYTARPSIIERERERE
jgi:hypothetical protein